MFGAARLMTEGGGEEGGGKAKYRAGRMMMAGTMGVISIPRMG